MKHWPRWVSVAIVAIGLAYMGVDQWVARGLAPLRDPLAMSQVTFMSPTQHSEFLGAQEQIARLTAENATLRQRLGEYASIRGESSSQIDWSTWQRAAVVARSVRQGRRYVEVDAGGADGLRIGQAAVLGWTLVGRVSGLLGGRALIHNSSDGEFRLPVRIPVGSDRFVNGLWAGTGSRDLVDIRWVEGEDMSIEVGSPVVSAGGDGVPAGLILGTIHSVARPDRRRGQSSWIITATPLRDVADSDSVLLVPYSL